MQSTCSDPGLSLAEKTKKIIRTDNSIYYSFSCNAVLECLKYSDEEIASIEESTRGHADNPLWHKMHLGMLTASNFHRFSTRTDTLIRNREADVTKLLELIFTKKPSDIQMPQLEYGLKSERKARKMYRIMCRKKH